MIQKILVLTVVSLMGCSARYHAEATQEATNGLTAGEVQRKISVGSSSAAVAEALGSPNVVSTDEDGLQVWVYDKTGTDIAYSGSSWFVTSGSVSKSQRTITVIVKFDGDQKVRDIKYHQTRF